MFYLQFVSFYQLSLPLPFGNYSFVSLSLSLFAAVAFVDLSSHNEVSVLSTVKEQSLNTGHLGPPKFVFLSPCTVSMFCNNSFVLLIWFTCFVISFYDVVFLCQLLYLVL